MENSVQPSDTEKEEFVLSLKDGIEIGLGRQDPLIKTANKISVQFPHHLVLLQAGGFLHAYDRSAYFLYKLKGYKLRLVGPENSPAIRCGLPMIGHKRSLWHVFHDYRVPYVAALGAKGNYQIYISHEEANKTLLDDIPTNIVSQLIEQLSQTDRLRVARAAQILLKPDQSSFRLKQVTDELYHVLLNDLHRFPTVHRFFVGKDLGKCISRIIQSVYSYAMSSDRRNLLSQLSGDIDILKMLLQHIHRVKLIDSSKFGQRAALTIEMGSLVGGMLRTSSKM